MGKTLGRFGEIVQSENNNNNNKKRQKERKEGRKKFTKALRHKARWTLESDRERDTCLYIMHCSMY